MSSKPVKNCPRAEDGQRSDAADRQLDAAGHNIHFEAFSDLFTKAVTC